MLDVVQTNYAEPVDVDKAVYQGAIPGMLRMLDPHSNFFDPRQFALLREDQRGKYYGVGMVVAPRDNSHRGGGSLCGRAGVQSGDAAGRRDYQGGRQIDGRAVYHGSGGHAEGPQGHGRKDYGDAAKAIPIRWSFTVTRDEIPRHSVDIAFMLKPGIGYIGLSHSTKRRTAKSRMR